MSGHSKWSTIKRKKGEKDGARAKVFTKISREIIVAIKEGGGDPNNNAKLATLIQKAKSNNIPNDNIDRLIKKAVGGGEKNDYENCVYEGYGPNGVAVIVDCLTDNRNRTAANVRNCFTKGGGNVGAQGCVSYMFDEKGQIIIDKEECDMDPDELMMISVDAGAEDFADEEDSYEIITSPEEFSNVREALEKEGIKMAEAEVTMIPQNYVELSDEDAIKKMNIIIDRLDEDEDVQQVYHNWDE